MQFTAELPKFVLDAAKVLRDNGYEAYLVGGSVRDLLLGKKPKDYDIATNAYPEDVERIFQKSIPTGAKFGTMLVLMPDESGENHDIEITTYRSEADYFGGRWPAKVNFTKTIQEDLARRDLTINAIALRLDDNYLNNSDIVDPFGGLEDLQSRLIRAVGKPIERFTEDGLRSIRACRLAANLGFEVEKETFDAISQTLQITKMVSVERVRDELMKLLLGSPKPSIGLELMRKSGLLELFIPELLEGIGVNQPEFHSDDVYTHTLKTVDLAEDSVKLAALFHDIGKPRTKTVDEKGTHFYGHDRVGAEMAKEILTRLRFSNAEIAKVVTLVRHHMFYYPAADWRKGNIHETTDNLTTLYLLRHGQSQLNAEGKVQGQIDDELTDLGRQQSEAAAMKLSEKSIDVIITSPLKRAYDTASIVATKLGLTLQTENRFKERNFGEMQGLNWQEFSSKYPDLANYPGNSEHRQEYLPSGESISDVESRVKVGLYTALIKNWGKNVLVVAHSGVLRIIRRLVGQLDIVDLANGEFVTVDFDQTQLDPNFLTDEQLQKVQEEYQESNFAGGWKDAAVRRFIRNLGSDEMVDELMKLRIADANANPKSAFNPQELQILAERIAVVREKDMALKVTDLAITGQDLMQKLGLKPGREIGEILNYLLEEVIEDPLSNEPAKLLELARAKADAGRQEPG